METPDQSDHQDSPVMPALPGAHGEQGRVPQADTPADLARVGEAADQLTSPPAAHGAPAALPNFPDLPDLSEFTRKPRWTLPVLDWAGKRIEWVTVGLALLMSLLLVPYVLDFSSRDEWGRLAPNLPLFQALEAMEFRLYDTHFANRGRIKPKSVDKIAIVGVDTTSLEMIGEFPWTRDWYAKLVRRLHRAGATAIVLDFNYHSYQLPKKDPITGIIKKDKNGEVLKSPYDEALIAAVAEAKNVVISSGFRPYNAASQLNTKTVASVTSTPIDELDGETPDVALNYQMRDPDGIARSYTICGQVSGAQLGSMATLSAAIHQKLLDGDQNKRYYQYLHDGTWPDLNGNLHHIPLSSIKINDDRVWNTPLYYYGPPGTFTTYSFSNVVAMEEESSNSTTPGKAAKQFRYAWSDEDLKQRFGGRIVFVGATTEQLKDLFEMPTFQPNPNETITNQIPGVELHATVTSMLLNGDYIHTASTFSTLITLFVLTLAGSLWTVILRGRVGNAAKAAETRWKQWNLPGNVHSLVWLFLYVCVAALPIIVFWQVTQLLFNARNLWVVFTYPAVSTGLSSGMALLLLFGVESVERRKVVTAFARKVSPDVLDVILSHPEEDYARPRRVHATVLFTDLEGFTTFSENHEPEEVVEALNDYLSRMVPVVEAYGGNVDKYIGDAIMAWFGAPVPRYDHAAQALLCAIAMQEECARFRRETGVEFYMRIGVHTGDVIIGDVGSGSRMDFTAIGDTVNLASRLEGKNKEFGSWIMCSAATFEAAPEIVSVESASAQIKGKSQAVEVFIVRGMVGDPIADNRWGRQLTEAEKQQRLMEAHFKRIAEAEAALSEAKELPAPLRALPQGDLSLPEAPAPVVSGA